MSTVKGLLGAGLTVCVTVGLLVRRFVFLRQASGSRRAHGPALAHVVRLGALMAGLLIILAAVATDSFASRSASTTPTSVAANQLAIQSSKSLTPLIILPSNKTCVAGRKLTIQFDSTPHGPWATVTIAVNGKRLKTLKRPHITRLVTLTGLPRGSFLIAVTGITRAGRARAVNRRYKACAVETAKEKAEREAKEKAEREAKEKAEREAKEKAEREAKEKAEREAKEKAEREAKEKAEREAKEKAEREAKEHGTGTAVAAGYDQTCAVLSSGHVECWGLNPLGNGSNGRSDTPVEVTGITDATQVTAGYGDACALLSTGHVECWGGNQYGELGNGSTTEAYTPVEVSGITDATQVTAGYSNETGDYTCALLSTGHVECWGYNLYGELGNGTTTTYSDTPVEVSGITDATQVSAGAGQTCALLSTGHVECWGANGNGELGDGGISVYSGTPVEVSGITDATRVAAGAFHTCAVLSTGHIECWGNNGYGQLGNGTMGTVSDTPVEVTGI
jgi:Regulator of chromosome condensation (RCC1) repeat